MVCVIRDRISPWVCFFIDDMHVVIVKMWNGIGVIVGATDIQMSGISVYVYLWILLSRYLCIQCGYDCVNGVYVWSNVRRSW